MSITKIAVVIVYFFLSQVSYASDLISVGIQQLQSGDYANSVSTFTRELEQNPNNTNALLYRGFSYYYLRQLDKAELDYKAVIKLAPNVSQGYFNYGLVLDEKGLHKEAIVQYKKAIDLNPKDASAYYNLGNSYSNIGDYRNAVTSFEMAVKLNPNHPHAQNNLNIVRAKVKS